jgi:transposase-like protein
VVVFPWRDATAAPRFFERAIGTTKVAPVEVVTDRAATYPMVLQELLPPAPNRAIRQQPGRGRSRPAEGAPATDARRKQDRASVIMAGHAFVQYLRHGHYELAVTEPVNQRVGRCLP